MAFKTFTAEIRKSGTAQAIALDLDRLIRVTANCHANKCAGCAMVAETGRNFVHAATCSSQLLVDTKVVVLST